MRNYCLNLAFLAFLLLTLLVGAGTSPVIAEEVIEIPDPNLEEVLRDKIGKELGEIYKSDLEDISKLTAGHEGVSDLTGLGYCVNLVELQLYYNDIQDLEPLSNLDSLRILTLGDNNITDLKPLKDLDNLTELTIKRNPITDLSPLARLNNLEELYASSLDISGDINFVRDLQNLRVIYLRENGIGSLEPLEKLTNLRTINVSRNNISNLDPLSGLINLEKLFCKGNEVSRLSPIASLTNLRELVLDSNSVNDIGPLENLAQLERLGLRHNEVSDVAPLDEHEGLINLFLGWNQVQDLTPLVNLVNLKMLTLRYNGLEKIKSLGTLEKLETLKLQGNNIVDISPLAYLYNLEFLRLRDNSIEDITPLVNNSGLANDDSVDLRKNKLAIYEGSQDLEDIRTLQDRGASVLYDPQKIDAVNIVDENLENVIRNKIGKPSGQLLKSDLNSIEELDARNEGILYLDGIGNCDNLKKIYLQENEISNIYPLSSLDSLNLLKLDDNKIYSLQALVNNENLGVGADVSVKNNYLDLSSGSEDMNDIKKLEDRNVEVTHTPQKDPPTKESETIKVPTDITSIQVAVDAAGEGDTVLIEEGTYHENVDISTPDLIVKSSGTADKTVVKAANGEDHVFDVRADGIKIKNLKVQGASGKHQAGILSKGNQNTTIEDCIFAYNYYGVQLQDSSENLITGSTAISNKHNGINLYDNSTNNLIKNCEIYGTTDTGIDFSEGSNQNTVENCDIHGMETDGVFFFKVKNNEVVSTDIYNCSLFGILMGDLDRPYPTAVENNRIINSTIHDCYRGVNMWRGASKNTIKGCEIYDNEHQAVNLEEESVSDNEVLNCDIHDNMQGVRINRADSNLIKGNKISRSDHGAVGLESDATKNKIVGNSLSDSNNGLMLNNSSDNVIYLNDFYGNDYPVGTKESNSTNRWYSETKIEYQYDGKTFVNYTGTTGATIPAPTRTRTV